METNPDLIDPLFMGDVELIAHMHELARRLSYFNAAEGDAYTKERPFREATKAKFWTAYGIAKDRGLVAEGELREYLL